ncbi:hypothetical protein A4D02_09735 [Niastella koreensis]|uniref:Uncharacterized protein n=2 Tax=Niastella koreensis TaxID=354356 RepID=G8TNB7_NIAKG|nr:hypothetical protein [Niastella koreensis]AEV98819.1 hypothetical protein Niako_2478 [Niastella koreensis GR20-10]OQP43754.1 hypothetical protein A4D02_09735 [Niastella koreensis]
MDDLNEMANLHSAGAIVRHISPFTQLPIPKNTDELTYEFVIKWASPYYLNIGVNDNSTCIEAIKQAKPEITTDICLSLLGDLNWRTRKVETLRGGNTNIQCRQHCEKIISTPYPGYYPDERGCAAG